MKIYNHLFFVWLLVIGLVFPSYSYSKIKGFLPIKTFPPVLVQKVDSCIVSCKDVKVFVTNNCIYEITPAEILGECFALFQGYVIVYDGVNMSTVRGGVIDRLGIFPFTIYNSKGGLVCLGQVSARDTIGPVFKDDVAKRDWESRDTLILSENDIPSVLNNNLNWTSTDSPFYLGTPSVKDGCNPNFIHRNVKDELISFPCDSIIKFKNGRSYPHLIAKIRRTFTFTDNSSNKTDFIQEIFFRKLGNASSCDLPATVAYDYAPASIYSFGPLGDNARLKTHPDFPVGKVDLNNSFYKCEAPDDLRFDVCSISDSMQLDRIIKAVYSAFYQWPNGFKDTISIFDKQNLWKVSYKSRVYSACNDGKRVRIILTIEDLCQNKIINDTLWIYFTRTSGPSFPSLTGTQNSVLGRNAANPVFIPLPGNVCKSNILLPFTHGTDERDLGKWFNWTVKDECTQRANLLLNYVVESKLIAVSGKYKSSSTWNKLNYPLIHTSLGSSINDVPAGTHRIIVSATAGECEAISYDTLYFVIQDQVFPRVRSKPSVTIPLLYNANANWYLNGRTNKVSARVRTDMVNNGSSDNCSLDTLYVRRVVSASCIAENFLGNNDYDLFGNKDGKVSIEDFERISTGKNAGLYYTPRFMPYIEYFCCDFEKENFAELWASDIGFGAFSNQSYAEFQVFIEDAMNPVLFSPNLNADPNLKAKNWVSCTDSISLSALRDEFNSNKIFGAPDIFGLDCTGKVSYHTVDYVKCGSGHITRHWTVEKLVRNIPVSIRDSQIVLVRPSRQFMLNIPADTTAFCGDEAAQTLTVSSSACDLLAVSYTDSLLSRQNNKINCLTIQRTYTAINWCDVPPSADCADISANPAKYARSIPRQLNKNGKATPFSLAISKLNAENNRLISKNDSVVFDSSRLLAGSSSAGFTPVYLTDYPSENVPICKNDLVFAWKYTQMLTLVDTIKPSVLIPASPIIIKSNGSCNLPVSLSFEVKDNCAFSNISLDSITLFEKNTQKQIAWQGKLNDGIYENGFLTVKLNPIQLGNYDIRVVVSDNCQQKSTAILPVSVIPSNLESFDCIERLTKNMQLLSSQDSGYVKVTISEVLKDKSLMSILPSCFPGSYFSIKKVSDLTENYLPTQADSTIQIGCASFTKQLIPLKVFLTDKNGLSVSCDVSLFLTDSSNICGPKYTISGAINTVTAKPLRDVRVNLNLFSSLNGITNGSGLFSIPSVPAGGPYVLKPVSPGDYKNGVSTLDLVLLQRYILQGQPFKTPYQFLAADIDQSGTISVRDLLELRKLVINLTSKFDKNNSWRFIPTHFVFPDSTNPWQTPFPEEISFPLISKDTSGSFIAIKIGDLSGDASNDLNPGVQIRGINPSLPLYYTISEAAQKGDYLVSFFFDEKTRPEGFQSSIHWKTDFPSQVTFLPGILKDENVNLVSERAYLNVSSENLDKDGLLFSLLFSSTHDPLNDFFLSDHILVPEAYQGAQIIPIHLIKKEFKKDEFCFYPPVPNPFSQETMLSFYLPQSSNTEILVSDLSGRILKKISGEGIKGLNKWTLNLSEIPADNFLFCKIKAGGFEGIQQLIKIK